jgi:hypothetical protein
MRSTWFTRGARTALFVIALAAAIGVAPAAARPKPGVKRAGSNLFALTAAIMQVNHQYCPVINTGNVCTDPSGNGVIEGGFWPKGTPDSYIFNSGLQIGGVIPANAGFAWAGDTVGAFFMDPRGDQQDGAPLTLVFNSLDAGDVGSWPSPEGVVTDTSIYSNVLLGRNGVSQQDLWFRAWDGNPTKLGGRAHPMGVLVETRGMAWNFPTGNEDIIYFVYTFTNVTSAVQATYEASTTITNPNKTYRDNLSALGTQFQQLNATKFGVTIPIDGYEIDNVFAAFFEDCDVGTDHVAQNYSTAVFPFSMGVCWEAPFNEQSWTSSGSYNPSIFTAPTFAAVPGFTSVKYLASPKDSTGKQFGITVFSNTLNAATGYPDPVGIKQMYRYLSGTSSPAGGDNPCSFQGEVSALHYCYLSQTSADTRFFESSGPFTLKPGQSSTIVVAYINAPAVNTPYLQTQIGGDFKPLFPATGDSIFLNPAKVRPIENVMGWVSQTDVNNDQVIEQKEVQTVPRSLLSKALVAQAVFDAKFLLPFAPDPPQFFLIPGDNQVTVVWQKSPTEDPVTGGDPYFAVASQPLNLDGTANALYDPDFRRFDVEGYRIYRGRTPGNLTLVAQFDYSGTQMVDYSGQFNWGNCAPELGVDSTTVGNTCPQQFDSTSIANGIGTAVPLVGNVVQIPAGGRVKLADGSVFVTTADTAVSGGGSGFPALSDNGVNFAYVDRSVRNVFQYFYSVTAFDVNSVHSGPTSLESAKATKAVTPRAASGNTTQTAIVQGVYGADGTQLNPSAPFPSIDPNTGTFSGNIPPANDGSMALSAAAVEALPKGNIQVTIDSVSAGLPNGVGAPPTGYLTISTVTTTVHLAMPMPVPSFSESGVPGDEPGWRYTLNEPIVSYDSAAARRFGIAFTQDVRMPLSFSASTAPLIFNSPSVGIGTLRFAHGDQTGASAYLAHSRWFAEGGTEPPQPTIVSAPDSAHNAGALPGVSKIWAPSDFRDANVGDRFRSQAYTAVSWYPGDFTITWNADSSISVFDDTHHSPLPYAPNGGTGWGFVNLTALTAAGVTLANIHSADANASTLGNVTYNHFYVSPGTCTARGLPCITLGQKAQYEPLDLNIDGVQDASGIALLFNQEPFIMAMAAIPAAGTKWHLRAVSGVMSASCTPAIQPIMTGCTNYKFTPADVRPSFAPGLTYRIAVTTNYAVDSTKSGDLSLVHTVPDPYYVTNSLEITPNNKVLKFVNVPSRAIVRIYSVSGILVQVLTHNDKTGGGELDWDLRNRSNQFVASGVYFYHVEGPDGQTKVGRFTVVQFAP